MVVPVVSVSEVSVVSDLDVSVAVVKVRDSVEVDEDVTV